MNKDFIRKARGVSALKCHLVLTTKYRRKVLTDLMLTRLESIFRDLMEKWEGRLIEFNGESDHVHLLLQYNPQTEPSKLINNLKTVSSRYLRKEFATEINQVYWKEVFWTNGYFIASCGGVTVEQLKKYINEQDRPTE
ncbi:IS200/IS605 family transposase [Lyngbya sp. CCAP 1446/10]|uniref:IS200/IS605 family transposase n=1 Tax=Lyngbya sp. CCAP 1446/10 TaxID=439293 RepID=UPI0022381808|nr:IS200/IS605 family transposase [Lyngbya sp. CCAP 1446/10]MCW6051342.1 IS200/IS605 family transposase [Lyngbya sp. CCAP 1446/10]